MPRALLPGQTCRVLIVEAATGETRTVFESDETLVEAPNWTTDGRFLVLNGDGLLWRLDASGAAAPLESVPMEGVPEINNDHVLSPDGQTVYVSAKDGHIYAVPWSGGPSRRVTAEHPEGRGYKNYLHGVSPDGLTLAVVVGARPERGASSDEWRTNIALVDVATGLATFLTDDEHPDDGPEFSPDGAWIWFNTERFTSAAGHSQLARMRVDGTGLARILASDTVDWFPHPSPDASTLVSLSYEPGTLGHPENLPVTVRVMDLDEGDPAAGTTRDLLHLFGGQGAMNVAGWAPDSRRFACVDYPLALPPTQK